MAYQKLVLVGNLGRDPVMRYTPDGTPVADFSLATNRTWNNSAGERQEEVTWFTVTVWRGQAEVVNQYLSKGRQVLVEGRLKPEVRIWTGDDGVARAQYEVTAETVRFLGGNGGSNGNGAAQAAPAPVAEEEIPF